jgi:hypothetical protein
MVCRCIFMPPKTRYFLKQNAFEFALWERLSSRDPNSFGITNRGWKAAPTNQKPLFINHEKDRPTIHSETISEKLLSGRFYD